MYISEPEKSIPVVLDLFDEFSDLSGYKINWGKSAMVQLNAQSTLSNLSVNIPIKKQFTYLGIDIQPDVNNIVKSNYEKLFRDIERDLERWTVLPASLMSWIATLKMNVLPRLSFLCAMIATSTSTNRLLAQSGCHDTKIPLERRSFKDSA